MSNEKRDDKKPKTRTEQPPPPAPSGAVGIRNDRREIAMTRQATEAMTEIQSAIMVALQFPRNERAATDRLLEACKRVTFAEDVEYEFPRGKKKVETVDGEGNAVVQWVPNMISGPSVYLAREAARLWGNIRSGMLVINEDVERRTIEAYAWDMETNRRESAQDVFEKKVQRKVDGVTQWVVADERDLRELQNRRSAIAERNCLLQIIPSDVINRAVAEARETMRLYYEAQKDEATKKLVEKFGRLNVTADMLCEFLGIADLTKITPEHLTKLRPIYTSIVEGNSRWSEYANGEKAEPDKPETGKPSPTARTSTTVDAVLDNMTPGAPEDNRGHGADNLQAVANGTKKDQPPDVAQTPTSDATTFDDEPRPTNDDRVAGATSGSEAPNVVAGEDVPPMPADCLILQGRVVGAAGDLGAAERWLAKNSKHILSTPRKTFRELTAFEARTMISALDDQDIRL